MDEWDYAREGYSWFEVIVARTVSRFSWSSLFDSAAQVRLDHWHRGRVVLVGDAAWCLTLYSGMGASTGLAGADLLGTMLERHPEDVPAALQDWEDHLHPFVDHHLGSGVSMRAFFTPANRKERVTDP